MLQPRAAVQLVGIHAGVQRQCSRVTTLPWTDRMGEETCEAAVSPSIASLGRERRPCHRVACRRVSARW